MAPSYGRTQEQHDNMPRNNSTRAAKLEDLFKPY